MSTNHCTVIQPDAEGVPTPCKEPAVGWQRITTLGKEGEPKATSTLHFCAKHWKEYHKDV
jgi:hypothetical protein